MLLAGFVPQNAEGAILSTHTVVSVDVQVAMLDWTQPLRGTRTAAARAPYVSSWRGENALFVWPRLERGILRVAAASLEAGSALLDSPGALAATGSAV